MDILEYFSLEDKAFWADQIENSDWGAGKYLAYLLKENKFFDMVGKKSKVLMLCDDKNLISFCTLAEFDDVQPTSLTPWIGFIYTCPNYRGKRLAGKLLSHAEALARCDGATHTYISTNHIDLYEKYGYEFFETMKDIEGEDTRVYRKKL